MAKFIAPVMVQLSTSDLSAKQTDNVTQSVVTVEQSDTVRTWVRNFEHRKVWLEHYLGPNSSDKLLDKATKSAYRKELSAIKRMLRSINQSHITTFDRCERWEAEGHNKRLQVRSGVIEVEKNWVFEQLGAWNNHVGHVSVTNELEPTHTVRCSVCGQDVKPGQKSC